MTPTPPTSSCPCGKGSVPEYIRQITTDIVKCVDCRTVCIDERVSARGPEAIYAIPPITDGKQYFCIRDYRPIEAARVATGSIRTCLSCQRIIDRLGNEANDRAVRARTATVLALPRFHRDPDESRTRGARREPRRTTRNF